MINLIALKESLESLNIDASKVSGCIDELKCLQIDLDGVEVHGRKAVDTLLGCMMAIDALIGEANNGE